MFLFSFSRRDNSKFYTVLTEVVQGTRNPCFYFDCCHPGSHPSAIKALAADNTYYKVYILYFIFAIIAMLASIIYCLASLCLFPHVETSVLLKHVRGNLSIYLYGSFYGMHYHSMVSVQLSWEDLVPTVFYNYFENIPLQLVTQPHRLK